MSSAARKKPWYLWWIRFVIVVGVLSAAVYYLYQDSSRRVREKIDQIRTMQTDDGPNQEGRKWQIDSWIEEGILARVEVPGSIPRVYAAEPFYGIDRPEQESMLHEIFLYYVKQDPGMTTVRILDADSGEDVGLFTFQNGEFELRLQVPER